MNKSRRAKLLEQAEELTHILETAARQVQVEATASMPQLTTIILQKLIEHGLETFHDDKARNVVVTVLEELRYAALIPPYLRYCQEREQMAASAAHVVRHTAAACDEADKPAVETTGDSPVVTSGNEYLPWEKNKIAQALEREGQIPMDVANQVAHVVESKILHAKIRYIATAQIRELVNSELFAMGYRAQLQKQSLLGIPKFNLKCLLYPEYQQGATKDMDGLLHEIAAVILRQYALEEVFGQEVLDAHLSGKIHIEAVSWPMKIFALLLPSHALNLKDLTAEEQVFTLSSDVELLLPFIYHSILLCGADAVAQPPHAPWLRLFLLSLSRNFSRPAPCTLSLTRAPGIFTDTLCQVYQEIDSRNLRHCLPAFVLPLNGEWSELLPALSSLCPFACRMHKVTFALRPPYLAEWPGAGETSWALDSLAINLVEAAYRAGKQQVGKFWDELAAFFRLVILVHLDKKRFFISLAQGPLQTFCQPPWQPLYPMAGIGCFLEIVGLPEAVLYLTGQEMSEGEGWELAVQTLTRLNELAINAMHTHNIHILLTDYMQNSEAQERFCRLEQQNGKHQDVFAGTVYTKGPHFRLGTTLSLREKIRREGMLHRLMPATVSLMPEMDSAELTELLRFARDETECLAIRVC
jgi:hypothetical protein